MGFHLRAWLAGLSLFRGRITREPAAHLKITGGCAAIGLGDRTTFWDQNITGQGQLHFTHHCLSDSDLP